MKKKNILIITQSLGIGGCETYILTQCKMLCELEYNVSIIAKDGILRKEFEKIGVNFFEIDVFQKDKNTIEKIKKIIQNENIDQVHIHPFYPFYSAVVASLSMKVPYILYFHGVIDIEAIFESVIGKGISNIFLKNIALKYASKYIYVSNEVKEYYEGKFGLEANKGYLLPNSIYFKDLNYFAKDNNINRIQKFISVSRLDEDKMNSVILGIDFYIKYFLKYKNKYGEDSALCLDICGDGNSLDKIKEFVNKNYGEDYNIHFIGASNKEVFDIICEYDVVFGMGRCILEAIAMKKIPVLVSYDTYIGCIYDKNINFNKLSYSNFSGRNLNNGNVDKDIDFLLETNNNMLNEIKQKNYDYINENNNIQLIVKEFENIISDLNMINVVDDIDSYIEIISYYIETEKDKNRIIKLYERLNKDYNKLSIQHDMDVKEVIDLKEKVIELEKEINKVDVEYQKTKNELNSIKSKKIYKLYSFMTRNINNGG